MKRMIAILMLLALPLLNGFCAEGRPSPERRIFAAVDDFRSYDGFEVMRLGSLGTLAAKTVIKMALKYADDEDTEAIMDLFRHIRKLAVIDYEDCDVKVREKFNARIGHILEGCDMLMELKDGSSDMGVYGLVDDDASVLSDFVMFCPGDCVMLCLFGSIPTEAVAKLAEDI